MNFNIKKVKIIVTTPPENVEEIREAVCQKGAGIIGKYSHCTSTTKTQGTFIPNKDANPYIGKINKLEFVKEEKLEFICDIEKAKQVIKELRNHHPYEEPAIDIVPLIDENDLTSISASKNDIGDIVPLMDENDLP